jgi:hypothetical protein
MTLQPSILISLYMRKILFSFLSVQITSLESDNTGKAYAREFLAIGFTFFCISLKFLNGDLKGGGERWGPCKSAFRLLEILCIDSDNKPDKWNNLGKKGFQMYGVVQVNDATVS